MGNDRKIADAFVALLVRELKLAANSRSDRDYVEGKKWLEGRDMLPEIYESAVKALAKYLGL